MKLKFGVTLSPLTVSILITPSILSISLDIFPVSTTPPSCIRSKYFLNILRTLVLIELLLAAIF